MKNYLALALVFGLLTGGTLKAEATNLTVKHHGTVKHHDHRHHWNHSRPRHVHRLRHAPQVYYVPVSPTYAGNTWWNWDGEKWWYWNGYRWVVR
ncbi:MAG TPA: hypothetical protein VFA00_10845 [Actinomycetota bacterium]|jgi:hypothetical protein|nr:hypothetical protein [Actinomycetota bacterium]